MKKELFSRLRFLGEILSPFPFGAEFITLEDKIFSKKFLNFSDKIQLLFFDEVKLLVTAFAIANFIHDGGSFAFLREAWPGYAIAYSVGALGSPCTALYFLYLNEFRKT